MPSKNKTRKNRKNIIIFFTIIAISLSILIYFLNTKIKFDESKKLILDNEIALHHFDLNYIDSLRKVYERNAYLDGLHLIAVGFKYKKIIQDSLRKVGEINIVDLQNYNSEFLNLTYKDVSPNYNNQYFGNCCYLMAMQLIEYEGLEVIGRDLSSEYRIYYNLKDNIWIRWMLFDIENRTGNKYKAKNFIEEALKINPKNQFLISEYINFKITINDTTNLKSYLKLLDKSYFNTKVDSIAKILR